MTTSVSKSEMIDYARTVINGYAPDDFSLFQSNSGSWDVYAVIDGRALSLEELSKEYSPISPRSSLPTDPVSSKLSDVAKFLEIKFPEQANFSQVISLEYADSQKFRKNRTAKEIKYGAYTYLIGNLKSLRDGSLMSDTLATPFCCVGRITPLTGKDHPWNDALFLLIDAFDDTVFILFCKRRSSTPNSV
jgi:hypothetical protein